MNYKYSDGTCQRSAREILLHRTIVSNKHARNRFLIKFKILIFFFATLLNNCVNNFLSQMKDYTPEIYKITTSEAHSIKLKLLCVI